MRVRGGGEGLQTRLLFIFSFVQHASTQIRKPATRGMASQHLWTFERGLSQVPINTILYVILPPPQIFLFVCCKQLQILK